MARAVAEREAEKLGMSAIDADQRSVGLASDAALRAYEIVVPAKPRLAVDAVLAPEDNIAGRYSGVPNYEVFLRGHAGEYLEVDRQGRHHGSRGALTHPRPARTLAA